MKRAKSPHETAPTGRTQDAEPVADREQELGRHEYPDDHRQPAPAAVACRESDEGSGEDDAHRVDVRGAVPDPAVQQNPRNLYKQGDP
jgi:hypothetical protein